VVRGEGAGDVTGEVISLAEIREVVLSSGAAIRHPDATGACPSGTVNAGEYVLRARQDGKEVIARPYRARTGTPPRRDAARNARINSEKLHPPSNYAALDYPRGTGLGEGRRAGTGR